MAKPLRIEYPGAIYHITSRGNAQGKIFSDDQGREDFLNILGSVIKRYNWLCHAYCLMDNHYHLMIETPDANLSVGMRQLNGIYTQKYNRRHKRPGHIFQGRYKSILIQKENYLLELCRYVVLNPVRVNIVEKREDWRWSSYRATVGLTKIPEYLAVDWIHGLFSSEKRTAQKRYVAFVKEGIRGGSPWDELRGQVLLGEDRFVEKMRNALTDKEQAKEIPRVQRYASRPSLSKIFREVKTKTHRNEAIYHAHVKYGYTLKEIADHLKIHYTTVSKVIRQRLEMESDISRPDPTNTDPTRHVGCLKEGSN